MGGVNDVNPYEFKLNLYKFITTFENTNVIVCEVPYNNYLNELKLNYEIRNICGRHSNSTYCDMNFNHFYQKNHIIHIILADIS